jgi:hypothetical protein
MGFSEPPFFNIEPVSVLQEIIVTVAMNKPIMGLPFKLKGYITRVLFWRCEGYEGSG